MKFVFNFIFFGLLFYVIWVYFPDAFKTLVGWAEALFQFIYDVVMKLVQAVRGKTDEANGAEALMLPFLSLIRR